jgi:hypothetical protein
MKGFSSLVRGMKTKMLLALLLSVVVTSGVDGAPSNAPPAVITGISVAKDGRTLLIRYERSGQSHEQGVAFTSNITDFRYCPWLGGRGVAVVASTGADEFYYATIYLTGRDTRSPVRIPSPAGKSGLLGIANTGGDSIVISAVQHRRDSPERLTGWMFIDNCPPIGATIGLVIPFEVAAEQAGKTK